MLNEQYDTFAGTLDFGDFGPTEPQRQVFDYLHGELGREVAKWQGIVAADVPAFDALLKAHGAPALGAVQGQ